MTRLRIGFARCGPVALKRVCECLGVRVSGARLATMVQVGRRGASLLALKRAARALGFESRLLRANYSALCELQKPLIVHLRRGHFDVVMDADERSIRRESVWPWRRTMSRDRFERTWSGAVLTIQPRLNEEGSD